MTYEETLCLGSLDEWDRDQRHPMDANTAVKLFVFHQTTEDRVSDKMQFFKEDQNDAKIKIMRQLK
jgi:hypothetical protein